MSLEATAIESQPSTAVEVTVRRIVTAVSALLLVGVVTLGVLILQDFTHALGPELDRRAAQIGQTISDDVARAVEVGVPVDSLVGVDEYLATFIEEFDEVEHLTVRAASGDLLTQVGEAERTVVHSFPIGVDGELGTVDVGIDQFFVASRLRDLALDLAVILVVALLVVYEVTVTVTRRIVSGAGLAGHVAVSGGRGHPSDIRLVLFLFAVAEELNKSFLPIFIGAADNPIPALSPAVVISLPFVAYLATVAAASPVAGQLVARVGQRRLLLLGLAAAATSHVGMSMAQDVVQIVGLRALTGVGYALATIACQEYLLSRLAPGQRTRAIGVFVSVLIGGTFAGTALGGVLADRLGQRPVFVVSAVLVVAVAVLGLRMLERTGPSSSERPARFLPEDVRAVLRNRRFVLLLGGVTVPMNVLAAAFLWYLVPLGMDAIGSTPSAIARSLMIYYLSIRLVGPVIARHADLRSSSVSMVGWGSVVAGLALLLPAVAPSPMTFTLAVLGLGLGHAAVRGPQIALALDLALEAETSGGHAATFAVVRFVERAGGLVGLLSVAVITALQSPQAATGSMAMVATVAGLAFLATQVRPVVTHA